MAWKFLAQHHNAKIMEIVLDTLEKDDTIVPELSERQLMTAIEGPFTLLYYRDESLSDLMHRDLCMLVDGIMIGIVGGLENIEKFDLTIDTSLLK